MGKVLGRMVIGVAIAVASLGSAVASAQIRTIDPNGAIDRDLSGQGATPQQNTPAADAPFSNDPRYGDPVPSEPTPLPPAPSPDGLPTAAPEDQVPTTTVNATYKRQDIFSAGERVFGKGAAGLGGILERVLKEQGEPNAYIAGREASGAFVVGLRYGSGTLSHKVEGDRPIYWTGPSIGFDAGGNASKVFVLVYNLYDTQDIYRRFPEGEGHLYLVGGFSATYLRRGNIVLIPVRLGVGVRAGVNIGYMKFSPKSKWVPF